MLSTDKILPNLQPTQLSASVILSKFHKTHELTKGNVASIQACAALLFQKAFLRQFVESIHWLRILFR